ncbi:trypsin-like serine protease [Adhaeretor mobilis]|uniref:Trypsin n=1 Tax=Adhaeretor mobilis TaxID=1930276 RepID=A0A517MTK8_9BACT|nr:Trypsin [Adhaeretor mobilis]
MGTVDGGVATFGGSSVLINEHWVLTAAHALIANDGKLKSFSEGYRVGVTDNFLNGLGENQHATEWFLHPDYLSIGNGPDLALLYFSNPFTTVILTQMYEGSVQVGNALSMVGYGQPGTPSTGLLPIDGNRRAGVNSLSGIDRPIGYIEAEFRGPSESGF